MPKGKQGFQKKHPNYVSKETYKIISEKLKGRKLSKEHREKSIAFLRKYNWKGKKHKKEFFKKVSGKNNTNWKGDGVGYFSLHTWIRKYKGIPDKCIKCGKVGEKNKNNRWNIHWANIDHKYRRNLDDYIALCYKCHKKFDFGV